MPSKSGKAPTLYTVAVAEVRYVEVYALSEKDAIITVEAMVEMGEAAIHTVATEQHITAMEK